jgi:GDP-L-fucose synthase
MPVILVTGGSGLVGSALLSTIGPGMDREYWFLSSKDGDLCDMSQCRQIFESKKPDYVIHLAACVGGLFKNMTQKVDMLERNLLINYNVVKCCHEFGVKKMVACLSTCIFPDKTTYPIDETMLHDGPPHSSNDAYAYAKRMLEIHCRMYRENYGDDFCCVIPTNIYGPHDNFHLEDAHVLPALIHKCYLAKKSSEDFVVRGSGRPLRQFIYSEDLARLIWRVLFSNVSIPAVILSVPESDEVSIGEVARWVAKQFDYEDRMSFDAGFSDGQYKKTASNALCAKLFPDFRFLPAEEGIQRTCLWFLENVDTLRK